MKSINRILDSHAVTNVLIATALCFAIFVELVKIGLTSIVLAMCLAIIADHWWPIDASLLKLCLIVAILAVTAGEAYRLCGHKSVHDLTLGMLR